MKKVINFTTPEKFTGAVSVLENQRDNNKEVPSDIDSKITILHLLKIAKETQGINISDKENRKEWDSLLSSILGSPPP